MTTSKDLLAELLQSPGSTGLTGEWLRRAEALLASSGDLAKARWLRLEREGYDPRTEATNLADVLGPGSERLVPRVLHARLRYGRVTVGGVAHQWPHFFVESVDVLQAWHARLGGGPLMISIELDVPPGASGPRALSFTRTVFSDVLDAIALEVVAAVRAGEAAR